VSNRSPGYRSVKRLLGETSLERKCRLLFGFCLLLLIGGAFWWVDTVAERLVHETARRQAIGWQTNFLVARHWDDWLENDPEGKEYVNSLRDELGTENYEVELLALQPVDKSSERIPNAKLPSDPAETERLKRLDQRFIKQVEELEQKYKDLPRKEGSDNTAGAGVKNPLRDLKLHIAGRNRDIQVPQDELTPLFEEVAIPSQGVMHLYLPIYWQRKCNVCHGLTPSVGAIPAHDSHEQDAAGGSYPPVLFTRVTVPYQRTQRAITEVRSILIAAAIVTVFVAMLALYVIVRYVVVKPLQHMREVSEQVAEGNLDARAELQTNDEFEDLATAFNTMLRNMVDSQRKLAEANTDIVAKADELAQANMRLFQLNYLKSDFLANMSHELRTPLNSIIGFSELLEGIPSLNDKQKRYALRIRESGRFLLEMINDILDLAKLEAGKMDVRLAEFRIESLIHNQCDMVKSLADEKNLDLQIIAEPDLPTLVQDQGKVQQILTNLLSNAIKFTPDGGRITVRAAETSDDRLRVSVADTGVGIAKEDREVIFEKFRQGSAVLGRDGLTREYSGTGLGLSIVKELCKLLSGEVTFESELGKGSTFTFVLPWRLESTEVRGEFQARVDDLNRMPRSEFVRGEESTLVATSPRGDGLPKPN
jgi:two-component system sensor histidine kinase BarA